MNKKALIFSNEFPPIIGGAGIVASELAKNLSVHGINITVLTQKKSDRPKPESYKLETINSFSKFWLLQYFFKLKKIDLSQFDSIIINDVGAAVVAAIFFNRKILRKTYIILHGSEPEEIFESPNIFFRILNFKKRFVSLLDNAKGVLAVSDFMKGKFLKKTGLVEFEDKIIVWYAGINTRSFYPEFINKEKYFEVNSDSKIVFSVSRVNKMKGYPEMYDIMKRIISNDNSFVWVIAGSGDYGDELNIKVRNDGLSSNIKLLGNVNRDDLKYYYSSADIFLLLSKYDEALPLVYLEAQACGVPAVGTNNAGIKEVIIDNKTGFLINEVDDVYDIISSMRYRNLSKLDISNFVNTFDIDKSTKNFIDIINCGI